MLAVARPVVEEQTIGPGVAQEEGVSEVPVIHSHHHRSGRLRGDGLRGRGDGNGFLGGGDCFRGRGVRGGSGVFCFIAGLGLALRKPLCGVAFFTGIPFYESHDQKEHQAKNHQEGQQRTAGKNRSAEVWLSSVPIISLSGGRSIFSVHNNLLVKSLECAVFHGIAAIDNQNVNRIPEQNCQDRRQNPRTQLGSLYQSDSPVYKREAKNESDQNREP